MGKAFLLSRKPAERRPGCEAPLQQSTSLLFRNGAVFKCKIDGLADCSTREQRLQKTIVFALEPLVVDGILVTVDSEENLFRRQHGHTADVPGFARGTGVV